MTRNFVSFIRLVVFVVVVSFGTLMLAGCSSPTAPTPPGGGSGGQGVQIGPSDLYRVGEWVSFVTYEGQAFPAKARLVEVSPNPGTHVLKGVADDCSRFPNTCFQPKLEACIDRSQYTWPGADWGKPAPFSGSFSSQEGSFKESAFLGKVVSGPDADGCWVFDASLEATNDLFSPFPSGADCCKWFNVTISSVVHKIGEEPNWDSPSDYVAYAGFPVNYQ